MMMFSVLVCWMVCWIFFFILVSSIMVVSRSWSLPKVRFSFVASSVRLMYSAFSSWASVLAVLVFPTLGVPVMRITCLVNCVSVLFL